MARYPRYEPLYDAFQRFLERCVVGDRSLLWPDSETWTPGNVADVRARMVDTPIFGGELSFERKLLQQMHGAGPQLWRIICDLYYVYFLPSDFIKPQKKLEDLRWAAQQGGLTLPPPEADVWAAQEKGFTRTSLHYHYKYAQFWLLLLFAERAKAEADRAALVRDSERVQQLLDEILEGIKSKSDRAYDMRHATLYLAFPERYERIISTRDKNRIVETYYRQTVGGEPPHDTDVALARIREAMAPRYEPGRVLDFYDAGLRAEWRPPAEPPVGPIADDSPGAGPPPIPPVGPTPPADRDVRAILVALMRTRNVILYGPPGTGKTYLAKRVAEALVEPQTEAPISPEAAMQKAIEGLTLHEVLALGMYRAGPQGRYTVAEINEQEVVSLRLPESRVGHPRNTIWRVLLTHTDPGSETVRTTLRHEPYLFDKDERSRWFLTDVGRDYVEQSLAPNLATLSSSSRPVAEPADYVEWATFHQSYSYEDFVEGLRPRLAEVSTEDVDYQIVPGVFRVVCERAAKDPRNKYVLVIDEINRGNVAKILGELITLLEDDKRAGQANALTVTLPYSQERFSVPGNLYIIGTMNSTDRSIALLDTALRRRFAFIELMPRPELLGDVVVDTAEDEVSLAALLRALNGWLRKNLDRDHQVGHSYLLKVAQAPEHERADLLEFVWSCQILPLLQEYFYSQPDKLAELLSPMRADVETEEGADGAVDAGRLAGEDLMAALARLARGGLA